MDDGQANGGDDQYDGDYEKEQQKNDIHLAEGEDEGEGNLRMIESIRTAQLMSRSQNYSRIWISDEGDDVWISA